MSKNNSELKRSWFFIILLTISSLALAGTAAYFSVFGLAKLFYGAGIGIIILASVLEFSKLVAVSYVYRYWSVISILLRIYYIFGIIFIMILTSMGIYGFLTSAYQSSANKVEIRDSQIKIAENKKTLFVNQLDRINKSITSSNNRIDNLTTARNLQEKRIMNLYDKDKGYSARSTEKQITGDAEQIRMLNQDITDRMKQASSINDSIAFYDQKIVEYKASDVSSEVGPLKYLSDLTGMAMNKVVNILVLLIIFVFDPMAISLLIGVNQLTMMEKGVKTPLSEERVILPKLNRFFRKKQKNENIEEDEDFQDIEEENPKEEKIKNIKKIIKQESKPLEKQEIRKVIYNDEMEYGTEDDSENIEMEKESKIIISNVKCPDGYIENKILLNKDKIRIGLRVYHDIFGEGIIKKYDNNKFRVLIDFNEIGFKELNPDFANLKEIICVDKVKIFKNDEKDTIEENDLQKLNEEKDIEQGLDELDQEVNIEEVDVIQLENISEKKNLKKRFQKLNMLKNIFKKK